MKDYDIKLWNTDFLPPHAAIIGMIEGSAIACKSALREIEAEAKNLVGLKPTSWLAKLRKEATNELKREAQQAGAFAVIGLRYEVYALTDNLVEVLVYGTAIGYCANEET